MLSLGRILQEKPLLVTFMQEGTWLYWTTGPWTGLALILSILNLIISVQIASLRMQSLGRILQERPLLVTFMQEGTWLYWTTGPWTGPALMLFILNLIISVQIASLRMLSQKRILQERPLLVTFMQKGTWLYWTTGPWTGLALILFI